MEKTKINAQAANKMVTPKQRIRHIVKWIKQYATKNKISTLVVGISGGIDSSVVSALCAETGLKTIVVQMPIRQNKKLDNCSSMQAGWLLERYKNVTHMSMDLTSVFSAFEKKVGVCLASLSFYNLLKRKDLLFRHKLKVQKFS
jgi:NH3-dependent NAD+ synthetase